MAEKEERIEISKYDLNNKEWNGDTPIDIQKVYTRTEAINRLAKKIDEAYIDENGCNKGLTMEELAKVALDALLSGVE